VKAGASPPARALVVLGDGPWRGRAYWADQFAGMQRAAARYPVTHPAGELAAYVRTQRTAPSTYNADQSADLWVFRPTKPEAPAAHDHETEVPA
jgi:hypothetical protein